MPYRNRNYLRPINTIKHVIDIQSQVGAGLQQVSNLVLAVENPVSTTANEVSIGSSVRTIFLNVQTVVDTNAVGAINNAYMYLIVRPGSNITVASFPNVNAVGISDFRKQIFHQEMAMMSDSSDSIPITLFKGVLKIPRKATRQGVNDSIAIVFGSPTGGPILDFCIQCIYKEIR